MSTRLQCVRVSLQSLSNRWLRDKLVQKNFILVTLFFFCSLLVACRYSPTPATPKGISFPYVVFDSPPFKIVLDRKPQGLVYQVFCNGNGEIQKLQVSSKYKRGGKEDELLSKLNCGVMQPVFDGLLMDADDLQTNRKMDLSFTAQLKQGGGLTLYNLSSTFQINPDGEIFERD